MADSARNATPGELVKRFAWEMEKRETPEAESAQFTQLRRDISEYSRFSMHDTEAEMSRLETYFSETR